MQSWTQAILWLSAGLYGYLIVHHGLQAYLSKERARNLWLIAFLMGCLIFSFVDVRMYQPTPHPPRNAYIYAMEQFLASSLCAVLFVHLLNDLLKLGMQRQVRALWLITLPLPVFTLLGWIVQPSFEARPIILGGYYIHGDSTPLGLGYSIMYLLAFMGSFVVAYRRWHCYEPQDRILLGVLSLMIPLVTADMLVYYGIVTFLPTWNYNYWVISLAFSLRLNAQIYQLTHDLAKASLELQNAYRYMVEQERLSAIGQVVRGIVHDMKNFFNNVQALSDVGIMRARKDPQFDSGQYFENIRNATQQAHQYLMDLLAMTHEEGDVELDEVMPAQIAREVEQLSGARLMNPPTQIVNNIPLNLRMRADRRYLMQLFLNLTLNSIQAMRGWNGERRIEYNWVEHPEKTILVVRDTGPGMPPEVRAHLFERAITTKQGGSGIGLMLVQRAIEKHNGVIHVQSEVGQGTAFVCVFPTPPRFEQVSNETVAHVA